MIRLENVSKRYGKTKRAHEVLDQVSFSVGAGEFVIIVGSSGAGKSTLFKMLTREEIPDEGEIVVGGVNYYDLEPKHIPYLRRKIGVVFQDFKLIPDRTVFENVAFALEIIGAKGSKIRETVPKALELVGLIGKEENFPHELSGGEKQRVAIARAVVRQPKILIADEPTGNLDPKNSWDVIDLLLKINDFGTTVLLTTHSVEVVNRLRKRVIVLEDGKIKSDKKRGIYKQ